jgi:hypothetical protein
MGTVPIGTTGGFAVLSSTTITSGGLSVIDGNVGVSPGSAIVGFPPSTVTPPYAIHTTDSVASQAQLDTTNLYTYLAGRIPTATAPIDLGGSTFGPGVYSSGGVLQITGTLTLDAGGNPQAQFIFQSTATLVTAVASQIILANRAQACNVFFLVPSSATLGTNSTFNGTIVALTSISAGAGVIVHGSLLARNAFISLLSASVTAPEVGCVRPPPPADLIVDVRGVVPGAIACGDGIVVTVSGFPGGNTEGVLLLHADGTVLCTIDNTNGLLTGPELSCTAIAPPSSGVYDIIANFTPVTGPEVDGVIRLTVVPGLACTGGDPHIVCLDGTRLDVYDSGYYRLFDNLQESEQSPVIINAQIVRDRMTHEDSYRKVWIKLMGQEYHLEFLPNGIRCRSKQCGQFLGMMMNRGMSDRWEYCYTAPSDETYTFVCELVQNTVALKVGRPGQIRRYNGLFAGKIVPIQGLEDTTPQYQSGPVISLYSYTHNALLCGSAQPHIVTMQRRSLTATEGLFRLLQTPSLCLNVKLGHRGLLCEAYLNVAGEDPVFWTWSGPNHWSLSCLQNGVVLAVGTFYERLIHDNILLRVQSNGSISCAFKQIDTDIRGLVTGDISPVQSIQDEELVIFETEVDLKSIINRSTSMYRQLVEP